MPRFHFNVHDGSDIWDTDGTELPDLRAARVEAIRLAGEVLKDESEHLASGEAWHMNVVDERGAVLFRIDFRLTASDDSS